MMPKIDGIETCRVLRENPLLDGTLIIFLTARNEDYTEISGFEAGGDDFIIKPIRIRTLLTMVEDLDMISKIETENLILNLSAFSIKDLISEVYKEMEFLAKKAYVSLNFKPNKCPDFVVIADKERIRQVVVNLVSNAIKYNKPDGKVVASCYDLDADHILIEFTDTGIGIKQKHLPRLFEHFYRVDKNRSRKKGGSGLGLAIVKHIIENHQQTVHVRSTLNVGTTFGFILQKYKE